MLAVGNDVKWLSGENLVKEAILLTNKVFLSFRIRNKKKSVIANPLANGEAISQATAGNREIALKELKAFKKQNPRKVNKKVIENLKKNLPN